MVRMTAHTSLIDVKGTLCGTTQIGGAQGKGTVFSVTLKTGAEKVAYSLCGLPDCADGDNPHAGVLDVKGTLYGTTSSGGAHKQGTVFALTKT